MGQVTTSMNEIMGTIESFNKDIPKTIKTANNPKENHHKCDESEGKPAIDMRRRLSHKIT